MNPIDNIIQITRDLCEAEARVQELRQALEDVCAAMAKPNGTPEPEEKPAPSPHRTVQSKPRHKRKGRRERTRKGTDQTEMFYRGTEYVQTARRCEVGTPGRFMRKGRHFRGVWLTEQERRTVCGIASGDIPGLGGSDLR